MAETGTQGVAARYRDAVAELGQRQKTSKGAPAYSRYVNRQLGRRFAAAAFVLGRTPNQVTLVSALLTYSAIVLLAVAPSTVPVALLVMAGLVLGYAFDAADGQLARLTASGSPAGEWLDHVVDAGKTSVLHLAVLVTWYRHFDLDPVWLLLPLAYQVVSSVFFFAVTLTDQLRRAHRSDYGMFMAADGRSSTAYSLAVLPTDYGLLCLVFGLLWWQEAFMVGYGLLLVGTAGFLALALPKWYLEVRALGRA